MGRPPRVDVGGYAYHVLNRGVNKRTIFRKDADFDAFERVLAQAIERTEGDVELLAYCLMSNHWHLVLRTTQDGALSPFMKWLTLAHTQRYRVAHGNVGHGPVYQGRFKSFLIQRDDHLLRVCRYVERNATRASLVERAEDWRWSSLWQSRQIRPKQVKAEQVGDEQTPPLKLSPWPVPGGRPSQWLRTVNTPMNQDELEALRRSVQRNQPYGGPKWTKRIIGQHGLESTDRPQGRPRKPE